MASIKIVAFGDAVTTGTSARLDVFHDCFQYRTTTVNMVRETQTWRSIIARILSDWVEGGVEVINAGEGGETSSKALARFEKDVLSQSPDFLLVMVGMEDVVQGVEAEAFRASLKKIVDRITARNIRPVLMTPIPLSERMTAGGCTIYELRDRQERLSHFAQVVRRLADEKSLPLIDLNRYFLGSRLAYDHLFEGWLPDGVAQSAMASFIAGKLLPLLGVNDFPCVTLSDYRKIYSDAEHPSTKHNGFTDITCFQGEFYAAFKTSTRHGFRGFKFGKTLVLKSADGLSWTEDAELHVDGFLITSEPKFLQVNGRLIIYTICHRFPETGHIFYQYGFKRIGPGKWSEPFKCSPNHVFWRPGKWRDQFVVAGYSWMFDEDGKRHFMVNLLKSLNGLSWENISTVLDYSTDGNETELLVENDTLTAFSRAEAGSNHEMLISTYIPGENRWETVSSGRIIQAPCVFKAGKKTVIIGRYCSQTDDRFRDLREDWHRFTEYVQAPDDKVYKTVADSTRVDPSRIEEYHHGLRTGIFLMDGVKPRLIMELLSAGDSGYTGVVQYGNEYLISDYSMHEYYPSIRSPEDIETPCDVYVSRIHFRGEIR